MNLLLKEFEPKEWSGLTVKNHLGAAFMIEPQRASKVVSRIHMANVGMDLDTYLNRFPALTLETDDDFFWELTGSGRKNIPLVAAYVDGTAVNSASKAGAGFSEFTLLFPEAHFSDVNIIVGEKNEVYPIQIIADPVPSGTNWLYTCKLITGDPELYIPYSEIVAGKRFSREWSLVEKTLSKKGGLTTYTSPFKMKNIFSMIRMQDTVPGNMIKRPVGVEWLEEDPVTGTKKRMRAWEEYRDWRFEVQFREEMNKLLYYSTYNRADDGTFQNKGKSGYELEQGAGIRQQIESSNVAYYPTNSFDIKWLTNVLLDLSINKLPQDQREFVLRTGERGMVQFSEALEQHAQLYVPLNDQTRVSINGNAMTYRGQFLEFIGPQGIKVSVMHDPIKDDLERNKIMHPSGGPAESYVYDVLDVGTSDGEPNIRKVYAKGQENIIGYELGLRNPFSLDNKVNIMSNATDGYTYHRGFIGGAMVKDPTRCVIIKPQILA